MRMHVLRTAIGRTCLLACVLVGGSLSCANRASAASLDPALLPAIQAATFEVVSAKPAVDPLTYEKPLPLDLLPYQERTDKYYSIGTAFAIGGGSYVTAGHVLLAGVNSLWGPPALRDNGGHVFAIDKVQKFSFQQDFVVFTLKEKPNDAALPLELHPVSGQVVYSVGNAYGTGVVIRDGLYTSDTPEDQDGRWKWMRFSAPASPGNSGGPLVDKDGKVVGIVLAKSPNENLNYALPIGMVQDAPDHVGSIDQRLGYQFDVFDSTLSNALTTRFELPLGLPDFFRTYQQRTNAYFDSQLKALLAKEPDRLFPAGTGSSELLHSIPTMGDSPRIIARDSSGNWGLAGEDKENIRLSANGYVTPGTFGKNALFHLRRPDDMPAARFYADPSAAIGLLLRSGLIKRDIGSQHIAVTALGPPSIDTAHVDRWGRRWQVREWPFPYDNGLLLVVALPVPDGYVAVARYSAAAQEHDQLINMLAMSDFMYANYDGTLAQWKDFLAQRQVLPASFADLHVDFEYDRRFRYASPRLAFGFTPELQAITPDSVLTLGFSFFDDHGAVAWAPSEVWVGAKSSNSNFVMLVRSHEPSADLEDSYRDDWKKKLARQHPFDTQMIVKDDTTKVTGVVGTPAAGARILYTATVAEEGSQTQATMQAKLALLLKNVQVLEH